MSEEFVRSIQHATIHETHKDGDTPVTNSKIGDIAISTGTGNGRPYIHTTDGFNDFFQPINGVTDKQAKSITDSQTFLSTIKKGKDQYIGVDEQGKTKLFARKDVTRIFTSTDEQGNTFLQLTLQDGTELKSGNLPLDLPEELLTINNEIRLKMSSGTYISALLYSSSYETTNSKEITVSANADMSSSIKFNADPTEFRIDTVQYTGSSVNNRPFEEKRYGFIADATATTATSFRFLTISFENLLTNDTLPTLQIVNQSDASVYFLRIIKNSKGILTFESPITINSRNMRLTLV